jgi:hypothetical protein
MQYATERLTARVAAVNKAHGQANYLHVKLVELFTPLAGRKICKADGTLLSKYAGLAPNRMPCPNIEVNRQRDTSGLAWCVQAWVATQRSGQVTHRVYVYVGNMDDDGTLININTEKRGLRSDYTVEEVLAKREAYKAAQQLANELNAAQSPFDGND